MAVHQGLARARARRTGIGGRVKPSSTRQRAEAIFQAAADLQTGDRTQFVHQQCADDDALRAEVMSLLDALERDAGQFLETPLTAPLRDAPPYPADRAAGRSTE